MNQTDQAEKKKSFSIQTALPGVAAILGGLTALVTHAMNGPAIAGHSALDQNTIMGALTAIASGIGLIFARGHTVSDETAGVTPQQIALSQAVHTAAAAPPVTFKDPVTGVVTITPAPPTPVPVVPPKP